MKKIQESRKIIFQTFFGEKIDIRYFRIICEYFPSDEYYSYSYLQIFEFTNYSYSYSSRGWLRKSIPIPIRGKNYFSLITEQINQFILISWNQEKFKPITTNKIQFGQNKDIFGPTALNSNQWVTIWNTMNKCDPFGPLGKI